MELQRITLHQFSRGLYLIKTQLPTKPGEHYAILDVGNVFARQGITSPVLYQLSPTGVIMTSVTTALTVLEKIEDERGAAKRFAEGLTNPRYSLFLNNCEHFARYVASGVRESSQAQGLGVIAAIATAITFIALWPGTESA
jgi:hypothetical protein